MALQSLVLHTVLATTCLLFFSVLASRVVDFQTCDRECRYHFGVDPLSGTFTNKTAFYDRDIVGTRVKVLHLPLFFGGQYCSCNAEDSLIPRRSNKKFDSKTFWCGEFDSDFVCSKGGITTSSQEAQQRGLTILHCGTCAACSNEHDLDVLWTTRKDITTLITECAASFMWHQDLDRLAQCMTDKGINFSTESVTGPSCMDCWTDNVMCDAVNCRWNPDCIKRFFSPKNSGAFAGCLQCDETNCGPEFIRCAGANRRSTGIISDIQRNDTQVCKQGYYYDRSMSGNVSDGSYETSGNVSDDAKGVDPAMSAIVVTIVLVVFIGIGVLFLFIKTKNFVDNLNKDYVLLENDVTTQNEEDDRL